MSWSTIRPLVLKDVLLYFRNRFFAVVTILAIIVYAVIYYVMPSTIEERLEIGLYAPVMPEALALAQGEGLTIEEFASEQELRNTVLNGDIQAGIVVPAGVNEQLLAGEKAEIGLLFSSDSQEEFRSAVTILLEELAYLQFGKALNIEVAEEVLGVDRVGLQIAYRDRMLPLFAVMLILTEMIGLSSLISEEVEGGTVRALLITPMSVGGFFTAKGTTGVFLAFSQVVLFMLLVGGFSNQAPVLIVAFLLGSLLVTGTGFFMAAFGKDLVSVMAWSIPVLLIYTIPAFAILFPGVITDWVKIIPSYYLVDTVHSATNFDFGFQELWGNLLILLAIDIALLWLGAWFLRRRLT